jgi:hypothetical protein
LLPGLSTNKNVYSPYKFIVIPIKYRNFGAFVYDSSEKQMLNAILLVIEQRKNEFDRIYQKSGFPPSIFMPIDFGIGCYLVYQPLKTYIHLACGSVNITFFQVDKSHEKS